MAIKKHTLKDGSFRYQASVYNREEKKHIYGSRRKLKKEAYNDEIALKHQLMSGNYISETSKTLNEGFEIYIDIIGPKKLKPYTLRSYTGLYNNHLRKVLGYRKMNSISPYEIQQIWNSKQTSLSNATITKLHTILNNIYKAFVKWGEINENPVQKVEKPSVKSKSINIWTITEAQSFLKQAKSSQYYIAFWLALNMGIRLGECLGLTWDCIDFEKQVVIVKQQLHVRKPKIVSYTKTETSKREISLSEYEITELYKYKQVQTPQSDLVCVNSVGGFIQRRNIRRALDNIAAQANVPRLTFHELRHTHASLMIKMGIPPKHVQERLGHADVSTTLNYYVHTYKSHHKESAEIFSNLFNSTNKKADESLHSPTSPN